MLPPPNKLRSIFVKDGFSDEELRLLARCLSLARRHFSEAQRRQIIADQLQETPQRSNNWIGKQLVW
jgi:hypothetical protein